MRDDNGWINVIGAVALEARAWIEHLVGHKVQTRSAPAILMMRQIIGKRAHALVASSSLMPL